MKDRLEEFVRDQRLEFDSFEPRDDLWGEIEKELDKGRKRSIFFYTYRVAAVAAIFLLSITVQKFFFQKGSGSIEIPELKEAESYYAGLIDAKLQEAKPLLVGYPEIEEVIDQDLSELDSIYNALKEDLKDNIANQEVISAMIENYRLRIEILEEMLGFLSEELEESDNINESEYEL